MELLINLVGVLVGLATLAGGVFAYVKGLGKRERQVTELSNDLVETREDLKALAARVDKTEATSLQLSKLPEAMEHMGEKWAAELRRIGDIWSMDREHTRDQLAEIKNQLNRKVGE